MEAESEPDGSTGLLSSGPQSALNPAVPWQLPLAASLTTGPAAGHTPTLGTQNNRQTNGCILAHKKTHPLH